MIPPLDLHTSQNEDMEKMQSNLKRFVTALENCPIIDGNLVEGIAMPGVAGNVIVNHGLGREPRGIIMTDNDYRTLFGVVARDEKTITIYWPYAQAATADFWVF